MTHNSNYTNGSNLDHIHGQNGFDTRSVGRFSMQNDLGRATHAYNQRTKEFYGNGTGTGNGHYSQADGIKFSSILKAIFFLILQAEFFGLSFLAGYFCYEQLNSNTELIFNYKAIISISSSFLCLLFIYGAITHKLRLWKYYSFAIIPAIIWLLHAPLILQNPITAEKLTIISTGLSYIQLIMAGVILAIIHLIKAIRIDLKHQH